MNNGRVVRVRMDSEGRELDHARSALDDGFAVLFHAIRQALATGLLRNDENDPILSLETEAPEDVYESQVREESGAVFYAGRRVVRFTLPEPEFVGVLSEFESAEKLLDELRDFDEIGFSIQPLADNQADGARWRIIVSGDFGPGGRDLDVRRERLYDAAKQVLEELRRIAPAQADRRGDAVIARFDEGRPA